ncbi:MAG: transcription elongation factor GreA [Erysipelotrichaceae bacterium]|nr:transcription elongation factor GreA [Erysipelotrichaceae bacterium]
MKDDKKVVYTASKIKEMKDELADLVNVQRPQNIEDLKLARSQGDLSENADYDAAKKRQGEIEYRIQELQDKLEHAIQADNAGSKVIGITDFVTFKNLKKNEEITVQVVSGDEADVLAPVKKISADSPLGLSLIGHKPGSDAILVEAAHPYEIQIISFEHAD